MKDILIGEFNNTGINTIDIDKLKSKWNHLFLLAEYRGENGNWRLVKFLRKDSGITVFKSDISASQARRIISELNLVSENVVFRRAFSWRKKEDMEMIREYGRKKLGKS